MVQVITREELKARLAGSRRPILVEALPEMYYRKAHLPSAAIWPVDGGWDGSDRRPVRSWA